MNNLPPSHQPPPASLLERAAFDPNFDIEKFATLVAMQDAREQRDADRIFNEALSKVEAALSTIETDANNPQTKSRYATYARLDSVVRPIYTSHGFGVSYNTEPMGEPNMVRVVAMLSNGGIARRFQIDMPIVTQGIRGTDMMTRTHATMSAVSYGKRNLLIMMFNLAIGDDDAGGGVGRRPPPPAGERRQQQQPFELIDPITGEQITSPTVIPVTREDYRGWGEKFVGVLNHLARSIDEQDRWIELNADTMEKIEKAKPPWFEAFMRAIGNAKAKHLDPQ